MLQEIFDDLTTSKPDCYAINSSLLFKKKTLKWRKSCPRCTSSNVPSKSHVCSFMPSFPSFWWFIYHCIIMALRQNAIKERNSLRTSRSCKLFFEFLHCISAESIVLQKLYCTAMFWRLVRREKMKLDSSSRKKPLSTNQKLKRELHFILLHYVPGRLALDGCKKWHCTSSWELYESTLCKNQDEVQHF